MPAAVLTSSSGRTAHYTGMLLRKKLINEILSPWFHKWIYSRFWWSQVQVFYVVNDKRSLSAIMRNYSSVIHISAAIYADRCVICGIIAMYGVGWLSLAVAVRNKPFNLATADADLMMHSRPKSRLKSTWQLILFLTAAGLFPLCFQPRNLIQRTAICANSFPIYRHRSAVSCHLAVAVVTNQRHSLSPIDTEWNCEKLHCSFHLIYRSAA